MILYKKQIGHKKIYMQNAKKGYFLQNKNALEEKKRMILIDIIKDHITYWQQILKLAKADLVKTYRGAALGWSWAIIKPAVTIFVYWFTFEIGLRAGKDVNRLPILFVVNCRCNTVVLHERYAYKWNRHN